MRSIRYNNKVNRLLINLKKYLRLVIISLHTNYDNYVNRLLNFTP